MVLRRVRAKAQSPIKDGAGVGPGHVCGMRWQIAMICREKWRGSHSDMPGVRKPGDSAWKRASDDWSLDMSWVE